MLDNSGLNIIGIAESGDNKDEDMTEDIFQDISRNSLATTNDKERFEFLLKVLELDRDYIDLISKPFSETNFDASQEFWDELDLEYCEYPGDYLKAYFVAIWRSNITKALEKSKCFKKDEELYGYYIDYKYEANYDDPEEFVKNDAEIELTDNANEMAKKISDFLRKNKKGDNSNKLLDLI